MAENGKLSIVFVMLADLRTGQGTETSVLNYIKYAPFDKADVTILQTNLLPKERIDQDAIKELTKNVKIITINTYQRSVIFKFLSRLHIARPIWSLLVFPIAFKLYKIKNKEPFQGLENADIVYLLSNNFSSLFKGSKAIVIGTTHCWDPGTVFGKGNKLKLFLHKLEYRRNSHTISGFHVFANYANYLPNINKKYNLALGSGVDTDLFHPKKVKNKKVKFLFLANLNECKGVKVVIEAWKRIKDKSNMELHIAGGGDLSDYVRKEAEASDFTYHGVLPLEELSELYRSCDVFVYPTGCDTFGLVVVEALSSGLYVIASENLRGIFDDFEKLKYLEYQPRDPAAIAKRMEEMARDKNILDHDRMKQYQYVKDNYSWEVISRKLFDFFFEVSKKEGKI